MYYNREVAPIAVHKPRRLPVREIPAHRVALGAADDYKPSMTLMPDGELIMVADRAVGNVVDATFQDTTPLWRSKDDGLTWSDPVILEDAPGKETFISSTSKGTLFMTCHVGPWHKEYECDDKGYYSKIYRSADRGKTWHCTKVKLNEQEILAIGATVDSGGTCTDRAPVEMADGSLILGVTYDNSQGGYLWRSTDDGVTWDTTQKITICGWYHNADGFFSNSDTILTESGKLFHNVRVGEPSRMTALHDGRAFHSAHDHYDRTLTSESIDGGVTWSALRDFGDYGLMYCHFLRLRDGRHLMTYTQRGVTHPVGLRAMLNYDDCKSWDHDNDQIILEGFTPWGALSGGGFGNTLEMADGTLVSCYSYRGVDSKTHVEVVRWKIPWSADERIIYYDEKLFDTSRKEGLVPLYDWQSGVGASLILRDYPYMKTSKGEHAQVVQGPIDTGDQTFAAELRIQSRPDAGYECCGLTLHELSIQDWSTYAGFVVRMHNAGAKPVDVLISFRDGDQFYNAAQKAILSPGESRDVFMTLDELKTAINVKNVQTISIVSADMHEALAGLLVSTIYLVKA